MANIDTGIPANSFELLREVCINNGWSFRENGVDENGDTIILVGDFRDIKNFGTGRKYEPLEIRYDPENEFPPTKWSDDIVYLEDFRATYNRNYTTHMFVYASQFSGLNTESITEFSSNNFDFVDQDFPIVRLPDNKWYVQNTQAYNQIDKVKYLTKRLQYQQETSVDLIDGTEYDESLTLEQMYKYAVAQLRRDYERVSYALDVRYLELVLPGSCMNLEIGHWVKDYNGWTKQVFDVNDTRLARNIQYNEQELAALIT